jgi:hypothetical protein
VLWFDASGNVIVLPETVTGVVKTYEPLLAVSVTRTPDEPPTVAVDIGSLKVSVTERPSALTVPDTTVGFVVSTVELFVANCVVGKDKASVPTEF